jgi:putative Mg2+ transporter-C (MgtC) family protein
MLDAFLDEFLGPSIGWEAALARLTGALLLGAALGWERESQTKPAGLRTHMMVCIASCLFTILALELVALDLGTPERVRTDPVRIIEAVTAGVAFLAAGMIFTSHDKVHGLTTGAGLWLAGAVGVSCGIGRLALAALATALSLAILWLLRSVLDRSRG